MFKTSRFFNSSFLVSTLLLVSCSFYSSAGRKQFEEKAPSQIQAQSFTYSECRNLNAAEMWMQDEFPHGDYEILEMSSDKEVWKRLLPDGQVEIAKITKNDSSSAESCAYLFPSEQVWQANQNFFLSDSAKIAEGLD